MKNIDMQSSSQQGTYEYQSSTDTIAPPLQQPDIIREVGSAHQELAKSLEVWEHYHGNVTPEQQVMINQVIINDAHNLAANVLPAETVEQFGINAKHQDDISFEHPPMLSDLFLLVRAYDGTRDEPLKQSVEYILNDVPPSLSEPLAEAFARSEASRYGSSSTLVMDEYRAITKTIDNELDMPHTQQLAVTDDEGFAVYDRSGYIIGTPQSNRHTDPFVDERLHDYLAKASKQPPIGGRRK